MIRTLTLVSAVAVLLAACSKKSNSAESAPQAQTTAQQPVSQSSQPKSNDQVQQKVAELAGSGAKDCGRPSSNDRASLDTAASCVMENAQAKKPFSIIYDMPGMSVGIAGNSEGKQFAVQAIQPEGNTSAAPQINVAPCPAELRVAQSGRVTCFPQGTMGVPPGAANPHAGAASSGSPHGGMGMPPPGTPNPHAGNMTTKPPAKTPPQ